MTADALAGDGFVTIVQLKSKTDFSSRREAEIETTACLGGIIRHEKLPDGRYNFLLAGRRRVRILREIAAETLYRQAEVEILEDIPLDESEVPAAQELLGRLLRHGGVVDLASDPEVNRLFKSGVSLGILIDMISHGLELAPALKQRLLEELRVGERLAILTGALDDNRPPRLVPGTFPPGFSSN